MATVGEIIRTTVRYSAPGASIQQNVFHHVLAVASTDDTDILAVLDNFITTDWGAQWQAIASDTCVLVDASVDVVTVLGTVVRAIGVFTPALVATTPGSVTSAAVAAYILLKTVFPKVRGIKYIPGIAEAIIQDGLINAAGLATMAFMLIEYATTLAAAGSSELVPGVPSKSKNAFVAFLDTGILQDVPAYQRRRKPNVGS